MTAAAPQIATVATVAVGLPRTVAGPREGESTETSIWKHPVDGPVRVLETHLEGDMQADLVHHGGVDKAVYVYGAEDLAWWRAELGHDLEEGTFGQNLTTVGYDLRDAVVGETWHVGRSVFEVAQPRIPCFKLGMRAGDRAMPRRFVAAERPGVYLRVLTMRTVQAGDELRVVHRPEHGVTVAEVFTIYHRTRERAARLLEAPELPGWYHDWARARV